MKLLKHLKFAVIGLCFLLTGMSADAEMVEDITVLSPKAIAMANAVTADPPGIDSIHFNPAGLTRIRHSTKNIKFATFSQTTHASTGEQRVNPMTKTLYESLTQESYPLDPLANQTGETSESVLLVPGGNIIKMPLPAVLLGGLALRPPESPFAFATAGYSPMAAGVARPKNDFGRYQSTETAITRITYLSPTLAFQVTDSLSIGAGVGFSYQGMGLTTNIRSPQTAVAILPALGEAISGKKMGPGPYDDLATFSVVMEDYLSIGFNMGTLWSPAEWLSVGFCYRSPTTSNLSGDFSMAYTEKLLELTHAVQPILTKIGGESLEKGRAELEFTTPQHMSAGISILMTPSFKLNIDIQRSFYQTWDKFTLTFDQSIDFLTIAALFDEDATDHSLTLQRNYQNSTSWSVGGEYFWSDATRFRAGYQKRNSAIPDHALDLTLPLSDADFYGIGIAQTSSNQTLYELSLGYLKSDFDIDYDQSSNANAEDPYDLLYNPYVYLPIQASTRSLLLAFSYSKLF